MKLANILTLLLCTFVLTNTTTIDTAAPKNKKASASVATEIVYDKTERGAPRIVITIKDNDEFAGELKCLYNLKQKTAYLGTIAVRPIHRNKGYGVLLWETLITELKKRGIKKLTWNAVPLGITSADEQWPSKVKELVGWYQKRGGRVIRVEDNTTIMELDLELNATDPASEPKIQAIQ